MKPIGVFDSGYGGLTVLKELIKELPQYDYLYLGDNARAPYGTRDFDTVYAYTLQCVEWFFEQGCHLIILACNTASAKALRTIQQNDLQRFGQGKRVLGVIRPTAEVIGDYSKSGHIGIFGTTGTVHSNSYIMETGKFFPNLKVTQEACPMWVPLVESNEHNAAGADHFVRQHIKNLLERDGAIDTVLLACTHYPLLEGKIKEHLPANVRVVSQGNIVAKSLEVYLNNHSEIEVNCSKGASRNFCTTGDKADFNSHASLFFGEKIASEHVTIAQC